MKPKSQKSRWAKMRLNIQPPWFLMKWTVVGPKPFTRRASRWDCVSDELSIVFLGLFYWGEEQEEGCSKGGGGGGCGTLVQRAAV